MRTIRIVLVCVAIVSSIEQSRAQCQDTALASLLRQILTPSKAPMAIQAIKSAAEDTGRKIFVPEMVKSRRTFVPNQNMLEPIAVSRERDMPVTSIMPANDCPIRILTNEMVRAPIEVQFQSNEFPCDCQRCVTRPRPESGTQSVRALLEQYPVKEFYKSAPVVNYVSPQIYPEWQAAGNPYLPIASPISALATASSNSLPPPTQARSHFLRKVPIPPPTL